jgi:hypothetical protein
MSGHSLMVAMRATTGRLSLSTTARARIRSTVKGAGMGGPPVLSCELPSGVSLK